MNTSKPKFSATFFFVFILMGIYVASKAGADSSPTSRFFLITGISAIAFFGWLLLAGLLKPNNKN